MMTCSPPKRHFPTPGQRRHNPPRHTAAGTAAPTTADTVNTVPQRANPTQTAYAHPRRRAQAQGQRSISKPVYSVLAVRAYTPLPVYVSLCFFSFDRLVAWRISRSCSPTARCSLSRVNPYPEIRIYEVI